LLCEARLIDGLSDHEVRALFNAARDADYEALANDARVLTETARQEPAPDTPPEARAQLVRLKTRAAQIVAIDFFGANGRQTVDGLLSALESRLREDAVSKADCSATVGMAGERQIDVRSLRGGTLP
jgi:hypothetical protein